ncbi:MAG: hypothetical protein ACYTF1_07900 [Planctomycetota bacterium]|jgi:hypothetical protein
MNRKLIFRARVSLVFVFLLLFVMAVLVGLKVSAFIWSFVTIIFWAMLFVDNFLHLIDQKRIGILIEALRNRGVSEVEIEALMKVETKLF